MIQELHEAISLVASGWDGIRVVVVGDVMLDRYIWGSVERISPEAPVPVVRAGRTEECPGGAANVAMNIAGLGATATLLGFCGDDAEGHALQATLRKRGVEPDLTVLSNHPTTTKLRILGGKQQMLRLDKEQVDGYHADAFARLMGQIESALESADILVLSDYAKGVLSEEVCRRAISEARKREIPILVDPKQKEFSRYRGATTVCPNLAELSIASRAPSNNFEVLLSAGQQMVADLDLEYLVATLSERGIAILRPGSRFLAPAVARQVFDVSGAGDTVIATLALCIASGLNIESAAQLANIAAGVVVGKVGTAPVSRHELLASLTSEIQLHPEEKVLTLDQLRLRVLSWRSTGEKVAFTNGCFDLLHVGHLAVLEQARREGDRLVVGINSDRSVSALKGPTRPIVSQVERATMLAALAAVDAVVVFDEPTPLDLILAIQPDVIVKGGDYSFETVVGGQEALAWNGRVKIVPTVPGFSTTKMIAKAATE
jgi:D-beta-D-heptose 7-phosphate kinase/D-beta-D-heptose 1-phosphate adenosyltransferase